MLHSYYIKLSTWGEVEPEIIDDEQMRQAELGLTDRDPDDYDYLCEAETLREAYRGYWDAVSDEYAQREAEKYHP